MEKPKEIDNEKALIKIYLIKRYFSIFLRLRLQALHIVMKTFFFLDYKRFIVKYHTCG